MGSDGRAIDIMLVPVDQPIRIRDALEFGENAAPYS